MHGDWRVVKLGGSLLDDRHMVPRFRAWFETTPSEATVLIVGGGRPADFIREAQRLHGLSDEAAHRMAIGAMSLNTHLLRELLPEFDYYRGPVEALPWKPRVLYDVVDCAELAAHASDAAPHGSRSPAENAEGTKAERPVEQRAVGTRADTLPCGWHVTSDSIAAWVAARIGAAELVLLKSTLPAVRTIDGLSRSGYCDAYFDQALGKVSRVRCVNLRSRPPGEKLFLQPHPLASHANRREGIAR